MTDIFIPREYYECVRISKNQYQDNCIRSKLKENNAIILLEENNRCIYKMDDNYEPLYIRMNKFEVQTNREITCLKDRVKILEKENTEMRLNHILGQCISVYFVKIVNRLEYTNFEKWYNIPEEMYEKYNLNLHKIQELKQLRNNKCHPYPLKHEDMLLLMGEYRRNEYVQNLIDFIYDDYNKKFK